MTNIGRDDSSFPENMLSQPHTPPWGGRAAWYVTSDGAGLWYSDTGQGVALLLLHGWMMSSLVWLKNVPYLAEHFRVITLDLRGHGRSTKQMHGHTLSGYARDIKELTDYLQLDRPVLVGWSLAGSVVLEFYRQFSQDVRALVLADANISPFVEADWNPYRMKQGKMEAMNAALQELGRDPRTFCRKFIAAWFHGPPSPDELDWFVNEALNTPAWIASAIHSDFGIRNYEPLLPRIAVPVAVLAAKFAGLAMGRYLAEQLPESQYHAFEKSGHLLFYEEPQRFNDLLKQFVDTCS